MDRRHFISELGRIATASSAALAAMAGASGAESGSPPAMPTIALGTRRITRLVAGSNPLLGYSYCGPHADHAMKEYFTPERVVEFLLDCERAGINTHQFSYTPTGDSPSIIRNAREQGSKMNFFCLARNPDEVRPAIEAVDPFAMVHHGGVTDSRFAEGKSSLVHDFV